MDELRGEGGRLGRQHFFVTDGQKHDYLSCGSRRARGETNKKQVIARVKSNLSLCVCV